MILAKKMNIVEYCQIEMIKLFGLDKKSQIKMNIYSDLLFDNVKF